MHQHAQLFFCISVEMWFRHVGKASLELLASNDPPALVSQSAGITDVSHHAWTVIFFFNFIFSLKWSLQPLKPLIKEVPPTKTHATQKQVIL